MYEGIMTWTFWKSLHLSYLKYKRKAFKQQLIKYFIDKFNPPTSLFLLKKSGYTERPNLKNLNHVAKPPKTGSYWAPAQISKQNFMQVELYKVLSSSLLSKGKVEKGVKEKCVFSDFKHLNNLDSEKSKQFR